MTSTDRIEPVHAGRTFEQFVLDMLVRPLGVPYLRPVSICGFQVDIGITPGLVIECKNRLDSHQSHRAAAVAWALRSCGWRGRYVVVAPYLPEEGTTDRTVLDCARTTGAISDLLLVGDDPTTARIQLHALTQRITA